jgi:hypothetical protein
MSSYIRRTKASNVSRFRNTVKRADNEHRTDHDAKKLAVQPSEKDLARARGLTLDDFGGRSDALGG